jgi:hypothetical protein
VLRVKILGDVGTDARGFESTRVGETRRVRALIQRTRAFYNFRVEKQATFFGPEKIVAKSKQDFVM